MEVVIWQATVIGSIAIVWFIKGRKPATTVAFFWTAWTAVMIFAPPLMLVQLASTWGTWLICNRLDGQGRDNAALEKALKQKKRELKKAAARLSVRHARNAKLAIDRGGSGQVIRDKDHRIALLEALNDANNRLCISSGWIRSSVVDHEFLDHLEKALKRGVIAYFAYGYSNSLGKRAFSPSNKKAQDSLEAVRKLAEKCKWPGQLHIAIVSTHEKLLICDNTYIVFGSHNWLSNASFINSERSLKIADAGLASQEACQFLAAKFGIKEQRAGLAEESANIPADAMLRSSI